MGKGVRMAILIVKIGSNEPENYPKYSKIYHHGDIVEVLPRHPIKGDDYSPGIKAEKEFLCVKIDSSKWTDEEFEQFRTLILQSEVLQRRVYRFDIENSNLFSKSEKIQIAELALKRERKEEIDVQFLNKMNVAVSIDEVEERIYNKRINRSLKQENIIIGSVRNG